LNSFNSTAASTISEPSSPTGDQELFEGYIQSPYPGLPTVSVTGISYPTYNLIVYLESDSGGRTGCVSTSGASTKYYYSTEGGSNQPASYVQITSTTSGAYTTGNYVVFTGLSGSSQTITLNSQNNWAGICGFQVQSTSTSSTSTTPISISFAGGNTSQQLQSTTSAGAGSYKAADWNVAPGGSSSTATLLHDASGSTSAGVNLASYNSTAASTISEPSSPTGDQELFEGYIQSPYTGLPSVSLSNIPFSNYTLVVYVESDSGGRTGCVSTSGSPTKYYYSTEGGANQPASYVQITSTTSGTYTTGNYVVFTGLNGSTQTITLNGQNNWAGICGVQIIP
jgi:hypothetical protein